MVKIGNYNLKEKRLLLSTITQIYGMGNTRGKLILNLLGVKRNVPSLIVEKNKECVFNLNLFISMLNVEIFLRKKIYKNIIQNKILHTYRGIRFFLGLPVNGQRTKSNGNTPKDLWKRGLNLPLKKMVSIKIKKKEKLQFQPKRKSAKFSMFKYQKKKGKKKRTLFPSRRN